MDYEVLWTLMTRDESFMSFTVVVFLVRIRCLLPPYKAVFLRDIMQLFHIDSHFSANSQICSALSGHLNFKLCAPVSSVGYRIARNPPN